MRDVQAAAEVRSLYRFRLLTPALRALFSATMPPKVEEIARTFLRDPVRILIGARNVAVETIKQRLVFAGKEEGKLIALRNMLASLTLLHRFIADRPTERRHQSADSRLCSIQ